jgi:hypothetical protein
MNVVTFQNRSAASAKPAPTALFTPVRERRERDYGVGYGNSSGYASYRRYSNTPFQPLFRCA